MVSKLTKMIDRIIENQIVNNFDRQKVTILTGSRRTGKTSLLKKIFSDYTGKKLWLNGEDNDVKKILENRSVANYRNLLQDCKLLVIDVAQHIQDIAAVAKLMIDELEPLHIVLTGSSAFELTQKGYPLVGRSISFQLYPLCQAELSSIENILETKQQLENRILFGTYPELLQYNLNKEKQNYLKELVNTYLLKDILEFENIKSPALLRKLLELLAWQTGNEVSETELGKMLGISKNTVSRYLDLLQKVFILFPLSAYNKNLRNEISKTKKWYFFDTGIRNTLINDFTPLALRRDKGALWENYFIADRQKINQYRMHHAQPFFWRTYDGQKIDYVEKINNQLSAFEIKWTEKKIKVPPAFNNAYPHATFQTINTDNYLTWLK